MAPQAKPAAGVDIAEKGTHFPFIKTELASRIFRLLGTTCQGGFLAAKANRARFQRAAPDLLLSVVLWKRLVVIFFSQPPWAVEFYPKSNFRHGRQKYGALGIRGFKKRKKKLKSNFLDVHQRALFGNGIWAAPHCQIRSFLVGAHRRSPFTGYDSLAGVGGAPFRSSLWFIGMQGPIKPNTLLGFLVFAP
jgi:hypothetical protein